MTEDKLTFEEKATKLFSEINSDEFLHAKK